MKMYTNFKKIFLVRVFWLKHIFRIKFKIAILDLMLLPKTVFHLKGYTPIVDNFTHKRTAYGGILSAEFIFGEHLTIHFQQKDDVK